MNRLLNGFNYFWDIPPSKQNASSWVYLHEWLKLLKQSVNNPSEPLSNKDLEEVAKNIFK